MTTAWRKALNRNVKQMHPDYARRVYESLSKDNSITGSTAQWVREHLTDGYYSQAISAEVYRSLYKHANAVKVNASRYVDDDGYNVEFFGARPAKCGQDY